MKTGLIRPGRVGAVPKAGKPGCRAVSEVHKIPEKRKQAPVSLTVLSKPQPLPAVPLKKLYKPAQPSSLRVATSSVIVMVRPPDKARKPEPVPTPREQTPAPRRPAPPRPTPLRRHIPGFFSKRYKAVELISRSEKGPVFKAFDTILDIYVAIKFLSRRTMLDHEGIRLFKQEASTAMSLSHENIVKLHNLEMEVGKFFLVMEFVNGPNFREILKKSGPLSLNTVAAVSAACASALEHAHSRGLLHRDLKPENLMLDERNILKIVDFGTARPIRARHSGRIEKYIEGTPGYMSPEQAIGQILDRRADIFSLAATLAELLTGIPPFPTDADFDAVCRLDPMPMPNVPEPVAEVLMKAMARNPEDRWATPTEFHAALLQAAQAK